MFGSYINSNKDKLRDVDIAKEQNCTDMNLTVNPNNENAIKVYEKFGMGVYNLSYMMKL